MSARDSIRKYVQLLADSWTPTQKTEQRVERLYGEVRAEVLAEAADAIVAEYDRSLWATKPGKHWAADLLRRMAAAPVVPVPDTTGDEGADASWLCPNNPLGHRWITRPFPEVTTPHCELCGRTKGGDQ